MKWLKVGVLCMLSIGCIIGSRITGYNLTGEAFCFLISALWVQGYEKIAKKQFKNYHGVIQFDKRNYDVPAMRFLFYEEPLNLMNCTEVTFKVDRDAIIKDSPTVWNTIDVE